MYFIDLTRTSGGNNTSSIELNCHSKSVVRLVARSFVRCLLVLQPMAKEERFVFCLVYMWIHTRVGDYSNL